ncbi:hypothetical protein F2Q68_00044685 [Brassica cretica]|uniref:Uncharacterized protein n=1 Tax=Brassica cretica TaxID=69181 RepID=A0A8S9LLC3_BRACR|nr:hypothetical protein F2Q68_00044685 [Brassica cretica]
MMNNFQPLMSIAACDQLTNRARDGGGRVQDWVRFHWWIGSVAMSNRFGVYESDFGWGRPVKVDVVSIRGDGISMAEKSDDSGGVEIGLCMKKADMDIVFTLFNCGLQN